MSQNEIPIRWGSTPRCVLEYQSSAPVSLSPRYFRHTAEEREGESERTGKFEIKKGTETARAWTLGGNLFTAPEPKLERPAGLRRGTVLVQYYAMRNSIVPDPPPSTIPFNAYSAAARAGNHRRKI